MLGKLFDKILHEDENLELGTENLEPRVKNREQRRWRNLITPFLIFLLALVPRLIHLFVISKPEEVAINWYGDVFHHWQIAYLSKEIGFKQGFLRLWDLKGMEYYWGLLHPLILILGFIITGTTNIVIPRMVTVIFGSFSIVLIFLLLSRYFNQLTGFAAALFLAFMPISLYSDTVGLQGPLGMFFLLLGIYLCQKKPFWGGASLMIAGMARAEYWLFGLGLTLAILLRDKNTERKVMVMVGYGILLLCYLKYLLDHTGNPIYPIYYNFFATVAGDWFDKTVHVPDKVWQIKQACQGLTITFLLSGLYILWKRPKAYLLYLLGLANLTFVFFVFGFGYYLYGYPDEGLAHIIDKLWVDRLMAWPYGFMGVLAAIFLFYTIPKLMPRFLGLILAIPLFLGLVAGSQLIWPSLNYHIASALKPLENNKKIAQVIARNFQNKGAIIIPEGWPGVTYFLVNQEKVPGDKFVSQMYDPFFYYQGEDPYQEWPEFKKEIIKWLEKQKAEIVVVPGGAHKYNQMLKLEEDHLFQLIDKGAGLKIYKVLLDEI